MLRSPQRETHSPPQSGRDVDQSVQGEPRHATTKQVIDPRLGDATTLGSSGLLPAFGSDDFRYLVHQLGTHAQVGSLLV